MTTALIAIGPLSLSRVTDGYECQTKHSQRVLEHLQRFAPEKLAKPKANVISNSKCPVCGSKTDLYQGRNAMEVEYSALVESC